MPQRIAQRLRLAAWVLTPLLSLACATTGQPTSYERTESATAPAEQSQAAKNSAVARPNPGEEVVQNDLSGDGRPDSFKYFVPSASDDGTLVLVRREMDLDFDGRLDLWNWYRADGELERQAFDLDFDGRVDVVAYFEDGVVVRKEIFQRFADRPDTFKFYEKGRLVRVERDRSGNGRVDTWEYWVGDQIDRIGQDLDGDGNIDRWTTQQE